MAAEYSVNSSCTKNDNGKENKIVEKYQKRETFGEIINEILKNYNLKNIDLQDMLGAESRGTVTKWTTGGAVGLKYLLRLSDVFPEYSLERLLMSLAPPEIWVRINAEKDGLTKSEINNVLERLELDGEYYPEYKPKNYMKHKKDK